MKVKEIIFGEKALRLHAILDSYTYEFVRSAITRYIDYELTHYEVEILQIPIRTSIGLTEGVIKQYISKTFDIPYELEVKKSTFPPYEGLVEVKIKEQDMMDLLDETDIERL